MKTITRKPYSEDRFFEVIATMPDPQIFTSSSKLGVPSIKAVAYNKDGVCRYEYTHSGLIGWTEFMSRLDGTKTNE